MSDEIPRTGTPEYAHRLDRLSRARWKRLLDVQAPYRRYLQRLRLGWALDVGCGIGRNLQALSPTGVGIDHNPTSVAMAREAGWQAFTPQEFRQSEFASAGRFDALLVSHVLEHMSPDEAIVLVSTYLEYLREDARVVMITPQERGFRSDPTHRTFLDFTALTTIADRLGLDVVRRDSFPFARPLGRVFPYNEFVLIARHTTRRQ